MFHEGVAGLPSWLVTGAVLGLAGSLLAALAFLAAGRLIPGEERARGGQQSGESRRRAEFREYLTAIGEPYAENHPVAGQHVAFYLPRRDVAITFDPQAYYRIEGSGTAAVLAEHEMPGSVLIDRLPFETPDVDFGDDGESDVDPARGAFAELGVPAGASPEEIERAYRRKVKEVHPDRGGDEEAFKRLREAYTVARDQVE
ncbi:MAG: J domain-containing protein [Haloarculaceae archaeon]